MYNIIFIDLKLNILVIKLFFANVYLYNYFIG